METPAHIAIAEELGYRRAWCYDSPAVFADMWVVLALAAERTERIGLGTAVLVPSLRHPMSAAAAIASVAQLAPDRLVVAVGTGHTGRVILGQKPIPWAEVRSYILALKALLRGETAQWEGTAIAMIHQAGFVAERPVNVPILVAANGPKGRAVAIEAGDGMLIAPLAGRQITIPEDTGLAWRSVGTVWGTVLDEGEEVTSDRVVDAAGPFLAVRYHSTYTHGGADAVDALPGGREWREAVEAARPPEERYLAVHEGHLSSLNDRDRTAAVAAAPPLLRAVTFSGSPAEVKANIDRVAEVGATELIYQPAGSDIPGELERWARAAGL